jgi:hypothetical protein
MDQISCISYLLHQSQDENIKGIAIDIAIGNVTLNEAKLISPTIRKAILEATKLYKQQKVDHRLVSSFIQEFMFVS